MNTDSRILTRLQRLVDEGEALFATERPQRPGHYANAEVDSGLSYEWATKCRNLLGRVFGEDSEHYKAYSDTAKAGVEYTYVVERSLGVLRAAVSDYEGGYTFKLKNLIQADILLEMAFQARAHLEANRPGAAVIVATSVLELALRSLCSQHAIPLNGRPDIEVINKELAKIEVYSRLVERRIAGFDLVRNAAGVGGTVAASDAEDMLQAVERFIADHLG